MKRAAGEPSGSFGIGASFSRTIIPDITNSNPSTIPAAIGKYFFIVCGDFIFDRLATTDTEGSARVRPVQSNILSQKHCPRRVLLARNRPRPDVAEENLPM